MSDNKNLLIVFAKFPEAGKVKTRLGIGVGDDCACELYESFLKATVSCASQTGADIRLDVTPEGAATQNYFEKKFPGCAIAFQKGNDLGEKLLNSFASAFDSGYEKICVIGSDSPDLPPEIIMSAFDALETGGAVIGPTEDGGYYLIGLSAPAPQIFAGIPWSTDKVYEKTIYICETAGIATALLGEWRDIDDVYDVIQLRDRLKAMSYPPPHLKILLEEILRALYAENPHPEMDQHQ